MNKQKHEVCGTKIASVRAGHEKKLKRIYEKRERYVAEKVSHWNMVVVMAVKLDDMYHV